MSGIRRGRLNGLVTAGKMGSVGIQHLMKPGFDALASVGIIYHIGLFPLLMSRLVIASRTSGPFLHGVVYCLRSHLL